MVVMVAKAFYKILSSSNFCTSLLVLNGVVLALATVLSLFTILLFDALSRKNFIDLGFTSISVFPLLSCLLVAFTLVAAAYIIPLQFLLLAFGVIALLAVGGEITYSIMATTHGSTPVRVMQVQAGPYPLTVSLYTYPAHASYALPFAIAPRQAIGGTLTYDVSSIPDPSDAPATPVRASLGPDANVHNGVQGDAEITVQGKWFLDIVVTGNAGRGDVSILIIATAPPALPTWLGWVIGAIPLYALFIFLLMQRGRKARQKEPVAVELVRTGL